MKKIFFAGLLSLLLAGLAAGQATNGYTNYGNVLTPPVIDATNFVNYGVFSFETGITLPFDFSDVVSYSNRNIMTDDSGWRFDTAIPSQFGNPTRKPALVFANQNPGQIYAGAEFPATNANGAVSSFTDIPNPLLIISATTVTNTGIFDAGQGGLISVTGQDLDLRSGTINIEGLGQLEANSAATQGLLVGGQFDDGWIVGRQTNFIATNSILAPETTSAPYIFEFPGITLLADSLGDTITPALPSIENAVF